MKKLAHRESQHPVPLAIGGDNTKKAESNALLSTSDIQVPPTINHDMYSQIARNSTIPQATIDGILDELLSSSNAIITTPVEGVARMVKSNLILVVHTLFKFTTMVKQSVMKTALCGHY